MIAVDTNILIYSHREEDAQHDAARSALESVWSTGRGWGLPWPCMHEFLAVVTNPKIYPDPTPMAVAIDAVHSFIEVGARLLAESAAPPRDPRPAGDDWPSHWSQGAGRPRRRDLHRPRCFGALDRRPGLSRFPELKTRNPLVVLPV